MDTSSTLTGIWLPLIVAGLVQASLALGVSLLTLLSGNALANKKIKRQNGISLAYIAGYFLVTITGITNLTYVFLKFDWRYQATTWACLAIVTIVVGYAILLFYYKNSHKGTRLWLPRATAVHLYDRTKQVKNAFEAFLLGVTSVLAEILFVAVPMVVTALLISVMTDENQFLGLFVYSLIATFPLLILWMVCRRGGKLSQVQRWRESNKRFLQILAGTITIVLGLYILVFSQTGGISW